MLALVDAGWERASPGSHWSTLAGTGVARLASVALPGSGRRQAGTRPSPGGIRSSRGASPGQRVGIGGPGELGPEMALIVRVGAGWTGWARSVPADLIGLG